MMKDFNAYNINQILCDNIKFLSNPWKYGFVIELFEQDCCLVGLDSWREKNSTYCWDRGRSAFNKNLYLRDLYYQIDRNHIVHYPDISNSFVFAVNGNNMPISLRELILFMIYIRHLSSRI